MMSNQTNYDRYVSACAELMALAPADLIIIVEKLAWQLIETQRIVQRLQLPLPPPPLVNRTIPDPIDPDQCNALEYALTLAPDERSIPNL